MMRIIQLRFRYWFKKAAHFAGFCPDCFSSVNYTTTGRAICPNCKR